MKYFSALLFALFLAVGSVQAADEIAFVDLQEAFGYRYVPLYRV